MSVPFETTYVPPVPVLRIMLAAPGEARQVGPLTAILDTGSDGSLVPNEHLERVEAVVLGDALLHGMLGESREVHLYEVDVRVEGRLLPSVVVVGTADGSEVVLGRNVLNKLLVFLDGPRQETELYDRRPGRR